MTRPLLRSGWFPIVLLAVASTLPAAAPLVSGLRVNERPRPFQVIDITGPHRGQPHCYVCEAAERPVVLIFARRASEPLARLIQNIDKAADAPRSELRSWTVFLSAQQGSHSDLEKLAERLALRHVPLTVVEDPAGPPSYRISPAAEVTAMLYKNRNVVANHAYREGELTDASAAPLLAELGTLLGKPAPK